MLAGFSSKDRFTDNSGRERDCMGNRTAKIKGRNTHSTIINKEIINENCRLGAIAQKLLDEYPENSMSWARERVISHIKFFHSKYKEEHNYNKSLLSIHDESVANKVLQEYRARTIVFLK